MNLLEYQAKALLAAHALPTPKSWLVNDAAERPDDIIYPVVAKSQVPVGGRGKAGGIVVVPSADKLTETLSALFSLEIKTHLPKAILLETQLNIEQEYYLALQLNRDTRQVEYLASRQGGIDIEQHASSITSVALTATDCHERVAKLLMLDISKLKPLLNALEKNLFDNDLLLCEINPLVLDQTGALICADAKCLVDDNARFRHPELPWPDATGNQPQPLGGTIGCIANGAGMAMSTMDTIVAMGAKPANFLDIGGGTGEKEFVIALKSIMELPGVTSIIVNIFAGISRCDEIARGIIAARTQLPGLPPLFIRLEGTNRDIALELLQAASVSVEPDLVSCVKKAMEIPA